MWASPRGARRGSATGSGPACRPRSSTGRSRGSRARRAPRASPSRWRRSLRPSHVSMKDGAFSPEHLAVRAAELGMPAVAMTDRDGLYGAARFVAACDRTGVHPLLGATLTLRSGSVVVLAQDAMGYANLCRLITDTHMLGERGDP